MKFLCEKRHMRSRRPYWCARLTLWELNSIWSEYFFCFIKPIWLLITWVKMLYCILNFSTKYTEVVQNRVWCHHTVGYSTTWTRIQLHQLFGRDEWQYPKFWNTFSFAARLFYSKQKWHSNHFYDEIASCALSVLQISCAKSLSFENGTKQKTIDMDPIHRHLHST